MACPVPQHMLSRGVGTQPNADHCTSLTSIWDPYFISYIRINPLGFSGSGHFRKMEFSGLDSQVTGPGMSSAPSVQQCKQAIKTDSGPPRGATLPQSVRAGLRAGTTYTPPRPAAHTQHRVWNPSNLMTWGSQDATILLRSANPLPQQKSLLSSTVGEPWQLE